MSTPTTPKPHDPRRARTDVSELRREIAGLLDEHPEELDAEAEVLEAAHQRLNDALQEGRGSHGLPSQA